MKTWVVVADEARARFFVVRDNKGAYLGSELYPSSQPAPEGALEEITTLSNPSARMRGIELETDRPGRMPDRMEDAMSAYEPRYSVKEVEAQRFARDVVSQLDQARHDGKMDRFYLLAAPNFLGLLRDEMGKGLQEALVSEQVKNVSDRTVEEIRAALPQRL
ncbi:MAG TPA: host attachment protein [Guyparkeria sp.]|nr:host attachment protein [Guyparkeria sp.]